MNPQPCISHAGEEGDCWRASLASVLNLPVEDVPNFVEQCRFQPDDGAWEDATRAWLRERGLGLFRTYCHGAWEIEKLLEHFSASNPGVPFILLGWSTNDTHAVVAMDGKVVHDPAQPIPSPLSGPIPCSAGPECCPGTWWIYVVAFAHQSAVPWSFDQ